MKEELQKQITELTLKLQELENRIAQLEKGEFGTGIYLDGCTDADIEYIVGKTIKKEGK